MSKRRAKWGDTLSCPPAKAGPGSLPGSMPGLSGFAELPGRNDRGLITGAENQGTDYTSLAGKAARVPDRSSVYLNAKGAGLPRKDTVLTLSRPAAQVGPARSGRAVI
jgi:hypothetical protein